MEQTGKLDAKTRALIRLGAALGTGEIGAIHWYIREAGIAGATPFEIRQAINAVVPVVGLAVRATALSWMTQTAAVTHPGYYISQNKRAPSQGTLRVLRAGGT